MEKTLHFIASYNSQIIQVGFGIVFLLIIIYVYRLFFMSGSTDSGSSLGVNSEAIEEKLNIIIDQQKSKVALISTPQGTAAAGGNHESEIEIDHLKAEIYNLHQKLKEANSVSAEAGFGTEGLNPETAGAAVETAKKVFSENSEEKVKLEEKVKNLESRLSEYEIIADDIAELSQLRTDNAKLIEQISLLRTENKAEQGAQPSLEDIFGMTNPDETAATENLNTETAVQSNGDPTLTEEDQSLMDDFAKNVLKKENE